MDQHLYQESKVTHEDYVIEGKANGKAEGPPNFKQPYGLHIRENIGYDRSSSTIYESMTNQ